jgi:adenylate kinase
MYEVVYLTGAPAAGKSSLTRRLCKRVPSLAVFEFGERLTEHLRRSTDSDLTQRDLRAQSAAAASAEDVATVDRQLLEFVRTQRTRSPLIIDSHPVTKEAYGFRVTPYSISAFAELAPTQIWMLYTPPEVAIERIAADAQGRPEITLAEAAFHTQVQASVAITYAMAAGTAAHMFDSNCDPEQLADRLAERLDPSQQAVK